MGIFLSIQVYIIRVLQQGAALTDKYASPRPRRAAFHTTIPAQLSGKAGRIALHFYTPTGYRRPTSAASTETKRYPLVVNFHGGGFTIGHALDDGRWATVVLDELDCIFVSVGYRKAPAYPQPVPVEDCVDALRWLWRHADEYGIDSARTVVTGFSAGGNLSLAAPLRHYLERKDEDTSAAATDGKLAGIVAFYPSVDQSLSRQEKQQSNPISAAKGSIPPWLYRMFDAAYYQQLQPKQRTSLNLSPALAPNAVLKEALPHNVAIYTCEWDMLLVEAEDLRKTLKTLGKAVGGYMVEDQPHGFDKIPRKDNSAARDAMYRDAVQQIRSMV